jgi:hypothetical protein
MPATVINRSRGTGSVIDDVAGLVGHKERTTADPGAVGPARLLHFDVLQVLSLAEW